MVTKHHNYKKQSCKAISISSELEILEKVVGEVLIALVHEEFNIQMMAFHDIHRKLKRVMENQSGSKASKFNSQNMKIMMMLVEYRKIGEKDLELHISRTFKVTNYTVHKILYA